MRVVDSFGSPKGVPMEQVQKTRTTKKETEELAEIDAPEAADLSITDDILDEIDSLLEQNAADFVQGFVQKGGQ